MKGTTLRFIVIVIIPSIILIGVGLYFLFQIPQFRYGAIRYISKHSIARSVRKGKISQANGIELEKAVNRFIEVFIEFERKVEEGQLDRKKIEQEIGNWSMSHQHQFTGPQFGMPDNDEEAEQFIFIFTEISKIVEKHLKTIPEQPSD